MCLALVGLCLQLILAKGGLRSRIDQTATELSGKAATPCSTGAHPTLRVLFSQWLVIRVCAVTQHSRS